MAKNVAFLCGVHPDDCMGHHFTNMADSVKTVWGRKKGQIVKTKVHSSREEAFNCKRRALLSEGYEQIGSREFRPPDGGPILVIDKKSKFGSPLRTGKENRLMFQKRLSGTIV